MSKQELKTYRHGMNVIEGRLSITEFSLLTNKSYRQAQEVKNVRIIVYVDGFNFYYRPLKKRPSCQWVNPIKLCENILNNTHKYVGLKYFPARVNDPPDDLSKSQRQDIYFQAIKTIQNSQIILGHFSRHKTWMDLVTPIERDVTLPIPNETKQKKRSSNVFKFLNMKKKDGM